MQIDTAAAGDPGNLWINLAMFAAMIAASAFFAGSETALTGASRARMTALESDGDKRAELVNKLRENKETLISALLLGNTFVNVLASSFATSVLMNIFGSHVIAVATVGVTLALLVFSEVMPKTYALMHSDRMALFIARPVFIVMAIFSPMTRAVSHVVRVMFHLLRIDSGSTTAGAQEQELRGAIALFKGADDTGREQEKSAMLRSILDLADVDVEEIMIHRRHVRTINAAWPVSRIVDEVLHSTFTRLPVWRGSPDNIVGVLHAKQLLSEIRRCGGDIAKANIANAMLEPWFIPQSATLFDQLQEFRRRREHFAVVVDEYGVLKGVVTLEDILEEIVGQIDDEHDKAVSGVHVQLDGTFVVDGKVTIRDLNREFDWDLPDEHYSTLAGLLLHESQRIPGVGQVFTFYDFRFEILKRQRNQITSVRVTPPPKSVPPESAQPNAAHG
jgi:Mg2+/Co2+ transporter CorB